MHTGIMRAIQISEKNCPKHLQIKRMKQNFSDNSVSHSWRRPFVIFERKGKLAAWDSIVSSTFGIFALNPFSRKYLFASSGVTVAYIL